MKRILFMMLCNFFYVPFTWIKLCYHAHHVDKYTDEQHLLLFKDIVKHANKGGRITLEEYGQENMLIGEWIYSLSKTTRECMMFLL